MPGPGCGYSLEKPCSGGHSYPTTRQNPPTIRWIQAYRRDGARDSAPRPVAVSALGSDQLALASREFGIAISKSPSDSMTSEPISCWHQAITLGAPDLPALGGLIQAALFSRAAVAARGREACASGAWHPCADGQDALPAAPRKIQLAGSHSRGSRPPAGVPRAPCLERDCRPPTAAADHTHARAVLVLDTHARDTRNDWRNSARLWVGLPHSLPGAAESPRARVSGPTPMSVVAQTARTVGQPPPDGSPEARLGLSSLPKSAR